MVGFPFLESFIVLVLLVGRFFLEDSSWMILLGELHLGELRFSKLVFLVVVLVLSFIFRMKLHTNCPGVVNVLCTEPFFPT